MIMAGEKLKGWIVPDAPAMAMAKGFGGYGPESEKPVRKVQVAEDEALKRLKEAWTAYQYKVPNNAPEHKQYENALSVVNGLQCSAADIEKFSIVLAEFQCEEYFNRKAGKFLSALMNNGKEDAFVIHTNHLNEHIYWLGYMNTKNITVEGDVGRDVGAYMKSGEIRVGGNADHSVGFQMEGGSITIEGNAGDWIGEDMKGGSITVNGNAGDLVGGSVTVHGEIGEDISHEMKGGKIHLNGEYAGISDNIEHGKIYHKGVLIVDK